MSAPRPLQVLSAAGPDAAEALFTRDGYAVTTIAAIAEEADVAVQTVYAVFGNKRSILGELLAARVVADDEPVPLRERPQWQALESEADARRQLTLLAALATEIGQRIAALYVVMAAAAAADPELASAYQRQRRARLSDQLRVARSLARKGALRAGLTEAQAADVMWTLASPDTYHALVRERGWSTGAYQRWLTDVLTCSLLAQPDAPAGP